MTIRCRDERGSIVAEATAVVWFAEWTETERGANRSPYVGRIENGQLEMPIKGIHFRVNIFRPAIQIFVFGRGYAARCIYVPDLRVAIRDGVDIQLSRSQSRYVEFLGWRNAVESIRIESVRGSAIDRDPSQLLSFRPNSRGVFEIPEFGDSGPLSFEAQSANLKSTFEVVAPSELAGKKHLPELSQATARIVGGSVGDLDLLDVPMVNSEVSRGLLKDDLKWLRTRQPAVVSPDGRIFWDSLVSEEFHLECSVGQKAKMVVGSFERQIDDVDRLKWLVKLAPVQVVNILVEEEDHRGSPVPDIEIESFVFGGRSKSTLISESDRAGSAYALSDHGSNEVYLMRIARFGMRMIDVGLLGVAVTRIERRSGAMVSYLRIPDRALKAARGASRVGMFGKIEDRGRGIENAEILVGWNNRPREGQILLYSGREGEFSLGGIVPGDRITITVIADGKQMRWSGPAVTDQPMILKFEDFR